MGPNVHRQRTALNEAFNTAGVTAMVWSFVGMDSIMSLEIGFPIEALLRAWALADSMDLEPLEAALGAMDHTFGQPLGQVQVNGRVG